VGFGVKSGPRESTARTPQVRHESWSAAQWAEAIEPVIHALGLDLSAVQRQQIVGYMQLLAHWNATFNLTAVRDAREMLSHHLADCLTVLGPLTRFLTGKPEARLLDVGSGGGLPGVVIAICCPGLSVTCVDTVGKKAAFIRQVAAELGLPNLKAEHARVETLRGRYDLITSRAFASLADFIALTRTLLGEEGAWMAMKGKQPDEELALLPKDINVFHVEQLNVPGLGAQRCLVWMQRR
jgi:16S rRNA (guanine527-N7)-methyltransferase